MPHRNSAIVVRQIVCLASTVLFAMTVQSTVTMGYVSILVQSEHS